MKKTLIGYVDHFILGDHKTLRTWWMRFLKHEEWDLDNGEILIEHSPIYKYAGCTQRKKVKITIEDI